jgi:hypothetical protein
MWIFSISVTVEAIQARPMQLATCSVGMTFSVVGRLLLLPPRHITTHLDSAVVEMRSAGHLVETIFLP